VSEADTDAPDADAWHERARALHEHGGVPERRAEVVALLADGRTHAEVADELGLESRSNVGTHARLYREQRERSAWLVDRGPDV
jgi:DNA-binding NarL/FixJ family response regulator